jgi:hypothetical protein
MTGLLKGKQYAGHIVDFSNSGNPVVKNPIGSKRVVVVVENSKSISRGDKIKFRVKREHGDHYQASRVGDGRSKVSKPDYSSPPNIPIHHDGKYGESVGDTRPQSEANASIEDRKFDPETHGAPEPSSHRRDRSHLRPDK